VKFMELSPKPTKYTFGAGPSTSGSLRTCLP
jgi:hypothetical protein